MEQLIQAYGMCEDMTTQQECLDTQDQPEMEQLLEDKIQKVQTYEMSEDMTTQQECLNTQDQPEMEQLLEDKVQKVQSYEMSEDMTTQQECLNTQDQPEMEQLLEDKVQKVQSYEMSEDMTTQQECLNTQDQPEMEQLLEDQVQIVQAYEMSEDMTTQQKSSNTQEQRETSEHAESAVSSLVHEGTNKDFDGEISEDTDSDTSSSSSLFSHATVIENDDDEGLNRTAIFKTKDELLLEDLPAVEELTVSLPDAVALTPVGTVSSIIQKLVIIQSLKDTTPLTDDSIIFRADRLALGKVFETFGPVSSPLYVLRFNSPEELSNKGLTLGLTVYCAPDMEEYTGYILIQHLKLLKGSDASWKNDQEPPEEALDYSDDEKEQQAKKAKNSRKKKKNYKENHAQGTAHHEQHRQGVAGATQTHTGAQFSHQNLNNIQPAFPHSHPPPQHTHFPPMYPPSPYLYPPLPPPPIAFPLYPPPPSFFTPSYSSAPWLHNVPFSQIPPPAPPPE
ncbi:H/ACA ribonucleoprotein complex non-core subunit NAF1-like isoform X1 [Entelurus aequoreus]|uniref:H/ACA ribonucleoprotein complex non-core subunit NAF1-like isoform X1 n=1 Tax=Entelurus aequoreus TaxID=161455 RepID=UPI002B1DF105|nr:H/ACA ribonucleoprotein complex non-core subunit NAF1-like isoform X1 [Entelurus aequoreus]XP_061889531.1 H/ACA ribonucleoprotein complex non-core subunit NAF1-like isoform X1 [Entelurus aequoreus]XP_061889532.1 H/ACA ribonucleoprotein complex non-core subunit NAF1-like isoform X1 [Entelurus aequoreus]